jgi:hypothetical protein
MSLVQNGSLANPPSPPALTRGAHVRAIEELVSSRSTTSPTTHVRFETKPVFQSCQRRCPCQCHIAYEGSSPRWLRGLLGAAFVKTSGLPVLGRRTCNISRCYSHSSRSGALHVQYVFPMWFLQLAVEATTTWSGLSGINGTWTFRIPRVLQKFGLYYSLTKCIRSGNSGDIMKFMTREGIRPFDIVVDQDTETTALGVSTRISPLSLGH